MVGSRLDPGQIAATLEELFLRSAPEAPRNRLRREDLQKTAELAPLLAEVARAAGSAGGVLVDAAAGKSPVGLIAAELVLAERARPWRVVVLERDTGRAEACRAAAARRRRADVPVEIRVGEVAEASLWPETPALVVALHACGAATDAILDRAVAARARRLLLVPCCYGAAGAFGHRRPAAPGAERPPGQALAERLAGKLAIPSGLVGRRFAQAVIDADRTLRLEESGYQTEVVELFSPQVSPFNLLWRARRVGEANRMRAAAARRAALLAAAS